MKPAAEAEAFNKANPVGTPVLAYTGACDENAKPLGTVTRTDAFVLSGHTAVVFVAGHAGCIALTHIRVVRK